MAFVKNALLVCVTAVLVVYVPNLWTRTPPTLTAGTVQPGFEPVLKVFRDNFAKGVESPTGGSAFSVYYKGSKVVDLWGGYADTDALRPWREDTMAVVYSSTKGMAATCVALLVDRGHLDYDRTVASYWPEFAQNGKENITVRMLLKHEAGLSYTDGPITFGQLADQDALGQLLAEEAPKWKPGSTHGYHGMTFGLYVSQLLRRADPKHRTLGQFFKEEIAQPFDVDFHIGLPLELYYRLARVLKLSRLWQILIRLTSPLSRQVVWGTVTGKTDFLKVMNIESMTQVEHFMNPELLALEQPSVSGYGTARAIAKVYGLMAIGGVTSNGRKFLSEGLIKKFIGEAEKVSTIDRTIGLEMNFNLGYQITEYEGAHQFGHPGSGGAQGRADPKWGLGMAYITSYPSPFTIDGDERFLTLEKATYECVKKMEAK